jgi:hypothetical protein
MKTRLLGTVLSLLIAGFAGCSTPQRVSSPRFTHMDLALSTHDRGKPAETRVEISILREEGSAPGAYLDLPAQGLSPHSIVSEVVPAAGEGFSLDDLKHEQILVRVAPSKAGSWSFSFDVILHFSDGTEALLGSGDQVLSGSRRTALIPLSLATVASPSTVGMLEKFGFRLLSRTASTEAPAEAPPAVAAAPAPASGPATAAPAAVPAPTSPKGFTRMNLTLIAGDRGKAAGTGFDVLVVREGEAEPVAFLDARNQAIAPNSTVAEVVPASGAGFTLDELKHDQVVVRLAPDAAGPFYFRFDAVLHFANGTEALLSSGSQVVSGAGTEAVVPLSLATVASRGTLGSIAKFAFKMTSKTPSAALETAPAAAPAAAPAEDAGPPPKHPKSFTRMEVTLSALDRPMDPGTGLEFSIVPAEGEAPVAFLSAIGPALAAHSVVTEVVPPAGDGFTLDQLGREQVMVRMTGTAAHAWHYKFDAVLHFADGTEALLSSGELSLGSGGDRSLVPLSLASVASAHSTFGRLEKYTFGLLSPGHKGGSDSAPASSSSSPGKAFTEMDVALTTRGRGKSAGTRLEILIVPDEAASPAAYLDVQGQALTPFTTVSEVVPTSGAGFTLDQLKHEKILVRITPDGFSPWSYKMDVILHFANGAEALLGSGDQVLSSGNRSVLIPLSAATVAAPNMVGSLQKFGFGLLNKIGH